MNNDLRVKNVGFFLMSESQSMIKQNDRITTTYIILILQPLTVKIHIDNML